MSVASSIKNYYEQLVCDEVLAQVGGGNLTEDEINDIACVALNSLPPRYICYTVDLTFYTSSVEQQEIYDKVENAVKNAIKFVQKNKR